MMNEFQALKISEEHIDEIVSLYNINRKNLIRHCYPKNPFTKYYVVGGIGRSDDWGIWEANSFHLTFLFVDIESDDEFTEAVYK